jgi:hypothetical protein
VSDDDPHYIDEVELSDAQRRLVLRVIGINSLVTIVLFIVVAVSGYQGAIDDAEFKRAGCERSKRDRAQNATGWRTAEMRLQAQYDRDPQPTDLTALKKYARIATGLEKRSKIDCAKAFPNPSPLQLAAQ